MLGTNNLTLNNLKIFFFIESIQIFNLTTIVSSKNNNENIFLDNFIKPLSDKEKQFIYL